MTNAGTAALPITSTGISGPSAASFNITSNTCGASLGAGADCKIAVTFKPSAAGAASASLNVYDSVGTQTATMTATGVAPTPAFTITPSALIFGNVLEGVTKSLSVTLTNVSSTSVLAVTITSADPAIDTTSFYGSCGGKSIPSKGNCTAAISFTPTAAKNYSATITLGIIETGCSVCTISYPNQAIAVTGVGMLLPPTLTPSLQDFGNTLLGTDSLTKSFTFTNPRSSPVFITESLGGANPGSFGSLSGFALTEVAPGATITFPFFFIPVTAGSFSATLSIVYSDTLGGPTQTLIASLTGTGIAPPPPTLTPSTLDFGPTLLGVDSPTQSFSFKNPRSSPVFITETLGGANPGNFSSLSSFGLTEVAPGATITFPFFFIPVTAGSYSATLSIVYSGTLGGPQQTLTASLTGTGMAPPSPPPILTPSLLDFGNTPLGTDSPTNSFIFKNPRSTPIFISETLGGANPDSFVSPAGFHLIEVAPGATITFGFYFVPKSAGSSSANLYIAYSGTLGGPQQTITAILVGTGITPPPPPPPTLTPSTLNFGSTLLGADSPTQSFTFKNPRSTPVFITESLGGANPGNFGSLSSFGLTEVEPGATITFPFFFIPVTAGPYSATLSLVYSDALGGPPQTLTAILTGTSTAPPSPPPTLTPSLQDFGNTLLGTNSLTQSILFKNPRSTPIFISETLGGANPDSFVAPSGYHLIEVAPGASIPFGFFFMPKSVGSSSATLYIAYSSTLGGPQQTITAILVGTGIAPPPPTLTPSLLDFGSTTLGTSSPTKSFLFKNPRSTPVFISETVGGANPDSFVSPSGFPLTEVAPESTLILNFIFTPKSAGSLSATLYIAYSSTLGGPQQTITAILTGTGIGTGPVSPVFSLAGGTFTSKQIVTLSDATPGSTIHFTVDGSTPTAFSTAYALPIEVDSTETIRAIAILGDVSSAVSSASYTINLPACQTINYSSGFTASGLSLNGGAFIYGSALELTDGGPSEARSAFFSTTLPTTNFTTDFTFQITDPLADGMTFTIQSNNAKALGQGGGGLGYAGIPNSVAIKVDLHNNASEGTDSIGTYIDGAYPSVPAIDLGPAGLDLHSGHIFAGHLAYASGLTKAIIKDTVTGVSASMNFPGDITAVVGNNAWFGFTAGTGGNSATQKILTWSYSGGAGCPAK